MKKTPRHLAVIMDGNGRWAKARGHNRFFGHIRGAKVAKAIIEECARLKVPYLTLFTFSHENWARPSEEINFLMYLLRRRLSRERAGLIENNIRFNCIGDLSRLPNATQAEVRRTVDETAHCTGMTLTFALSYGGQQELVLAAKTLAQKVAQGEMSAADVNESTLRAALPSAHLPDPDLIVRTSGESRLSNFFLWQAAYSEIYITPKMWPEFDIKSLHEALLKFSSQERRFGHTSEQLKIVSAAAKSLA